MNDVLIKLSDAPGVSGGEHLIADFLVGEMYPYCDRILIDGMGNLYGYRYGTQKNGKTIALCSHMDEVGLIISAITEDGYLKFKCVGGIDERVLLAKRVRIGKDQILGVTGVKAVHLIPSDQRKNTVDYDQMYIDIGATSKKEAEAMVQIGDLATFDTRAGGLGSLFKGKALDDRVGCYLMLELMKNQYPDTVCYCFTVQEETGLRGAAVASRKIGADACIVLENTTCLDLPGVAEEKKSTQIGSGPAITIVDRAAYGNKELRKGLENCGIKFQYKNVAAGGNDAGAIHLNNVKTAAVSIPCRYLHSPAGVISLEDLENSRKLLDEFLKNRAKRVQL